MKKSKRIILIIAILIIIGVIATVIILKKQENNEEEIVDFANTTIEQRELINDFLQRNPYITNIENFEQGLISDTDIVKAAIYSDDVQQEYVVEEDIIKNRLLANFEGYKKSIENIKQYSKEIFGQENLELNFVETYYNDSGYFIINEEYVFFSKQEQQEKIYIAVNQNQQGELLEIEIYEYDVTEENKENLKKMLETGDIDKKISIRNKYVLTGKFENKNIIIISKTSFNK